MEPYTIEDIELLRKKSGLSYQEAVALLDYHSGSLARALIDLEKHGRLNEENNDGKEGKTSMNGNEKKNETKEKTLNLLQKLYRTRVKIRKGNTGIFNVSVLFAGLCLLFAPHMTIAGIIVSLILGYQFSFTSMDPDFASENLEKMVKNAAQNANHPFQVLYIRSRQKQKSGRKKRRLMANLKMRTKNRNRAVPDMTELRELNRRILLKASENRQRNLKRQWIHSLKTNLAPAVTTALILQPLQVYRLSRCLYRRKPGTVT